MTQSDMESGASSGSGDGRSRWCFVIDTAARIVHTVETGPAPVLGVELDPREPAPCPPAPITSTTLTRPSFDTPWWTVTVEDVDRYAAGRTALALVEDDRMSYGLPDHALDDAPEATPAPTPAPVLSLGAGDPECNFSFADVYEAITNQPLPSSPARGLADDSFIVNTASPRAAALIEAADKFTRVHTYRGYLDHATDVVAPTADIAALVEAAEFWRREFTHLFNRASEHIGELEEELDGYRPDEDEDEDDQAPAATGPRSCREVPCTEFHDVLVEFQEVTWEVWFDLNGWYQGMNYGQFLNGPPLDAGEGPRITEPDPESGRWLFRVAVRATNSSTALEVAREAVVAAHGLTGDAFAVMEGSKSPEEAGTTPAQLAWVRVWAMSEREEHAAIVAEIAANIERLDQAGAAA